ncbi:SPOR domain-containing protein [Massilia aurea]|jgi:cell division protein FtsN|uniref:SPOR domain-containing protein n=1 Tax=Massilia aurea TaxID=373040 RepID=UPI00216390A7|nr:SPOR domain-containing protein [Massilia aurea]MCS0708387.1 SPOR domain-containing protein [Massilia aurea]
MTAIRSFSPLRQRGSTLTGIIIGLIIGLGIAVAVALVITKGASPFTDRSNKMGRPADLEPSQANDPNKPLYGTRTPVRETPKPAPSAPAAAPAVPATPAAPAAPAAAPADADPLGAAIAGMQAPRRAATPASSPAPVNTVAAPAAAAVTDGYIYYLQAGAFREMSDAENTRAKLALLGFEAAITDRSTDSGVLHRVRVGPFTQVEGVNRARAKLLDSGIDVAIVRNQR